MYKKQVKRKSDHNDYDVTSSSASKRKSFISPVVNREETLAAKNRTQSSSSNKIEKRMATSKGSSLANTVMDSVNSKNDNKSIASNDQQSSDQVFDRLSNKIIKKDKLISKATNEKNESNETFNSSVKDDVIETKSKSIGQGSNEEYFENDDQFDSEFERLLSKSNLGTDLDNETDSTVTFQLGNQSNELIETDDQDTDDQDTCNQDTCDQDEELFDSDAVNREEDNMKKYMNLDSSLEEELDENDVFSDSEFDRTLIFKSDDPTQRHLITQPIIDFDPKDGDFKTASGQLIELKMTQEQVKAVAKRVGIYL